MSRSLVIAISACVLATPVLGFQIYPSAGVHAHRVGRLPLRCAAIRASDGGDEAATEADTPSAPRPPAPVPSRREQEEKSFKVTDFLTALPYALGLVSITALLLSQAGYFDDLHIAFNIPSEWLEE